MDKEIVSIIKQIAKNLGNYDTVKEIVTDSRNVRVWQEMKFPAWETLTLSHGIPGICLLYGKLMECFPEEKVWAELAHRYLEHMVRELNKTGFKTLSMFSGASGIGLSVASVSNNFQNYNKLLSTINNYIINNYDIFLDSIVFNERGTSSLCYDVIEGLSGILSYCSIYSEQKIFRGLLVKGMKKLVELTNDIEIAGSNVPGWYIPSTYQFSDVERALYPYGNFNTSFSHGIAGPLTLLSEMTSKGIIVNGQEEAINKIIRFFFDFKSNDGKRDYWKGQIDFREYISGKLSSDNIVRRDAWCYGNPGICYSIIMAGKAMNKQEWIDYGLSNIEKTLGDIKGIFSPTFCHGFSGLYQMLNSIERVIKKQLFSDEKQKLLDKIMSFYDSNYLFGFRNMEVGDDEGNIKPFEYVGLLDGTVGVCLAVLEGEFKSKNFWKRAFLLA